MEERRQYVRLPATLKVDYTVLPRTTQTDSATKDVGGGGVRVIVQERVAPGTLLRVELTIPGQSPIPFTGEVVWSDQYKVSTALRAELSYEVGVRIVEVSPADRELLKRYVAQNL